MSSMKFSDVLEIVNGKNQKQVECEDGKYPIYGSGGIMGWANDYICPAETVIIGRKGSINNPMFVDTPFWNVDTAFGLVADKSKLLPKYLYYFCCNFNFLALNTTVTIPSLTKANLLKIDIPIPSLEEQSRVVEKLDYIADLISIKQAGKKELESLVKSRFIEMFGDTEHNTKGFPVYKLDKLCKVGSSKRVYQNELSEEGIPFLRIADINNRIDNIKAECDLYIPKEKYEEFILKNLVPVKNDILITSRGTLGRCYIVKESDKFYFQDGMISWLSNINERISSTYISYLFTMEGIKKQISNLQSGSTVAYLSIAMLKKLDIVTPPIELQQQFTDFVAQVEKAKQVIRQQLAELETLKKSLMQKYFG